MLNFPGLSEVTWYGPRVTVDFTFDWNGKKDNESSMENLSLQNQSVVRLFCQGVLSRYMRASGFYGNDSTYN